MADATTATTARAPTAQATFADDRRKLRWLRGRLILLVVGIALPLLALALGAVLQAHRSERTRVEARLTETARAIAAGVDGEYRRVEAQLRTLATFPAVADGDWGAVQREAQRMAGPEAALTLYDVDGNRLIAGSLSPQAERAIGNRAGPVAARAVAADRLILSDVFVSTEKDAFVLAALPVTSAGGQKAVLALVVPASTMSRAIQDIGLPQDWLAAILDSSGAVVSRSHDEATYIGRRGTDELQQRIAVAPAGLSSGRTVENIPSMIAHARAPLSTYVAVVVIPEAVFSRALSSGLAPVFIIGLSLIVAALVIAMLSSRRIMAAVRHDYAVEKSRQQRAAETLREKDAELEQSARRFQILADTMPQLVWTARPDGDFDYFNDRWYDFTGTVPGSTMGGIWSDLVHPDDRARAGARWRRALDTGELFEIEYRLRAQDGNYRWFIGRALPILDKAGRVERWFGTCTDMHDKKLAERALVTAQGQLEARVQELESLYDNAPLGLAVIDRGLRLLRLNATLAAMIGGPLEEQAGRTIADLTGDCFPALEPVLTRVLAGETVRNLELDFPRPGGEGERLVLRLHFYPVRHEAEQVAAIGAICEDVTAPRQAEVALEAEKDRLERLMISAPNVIYITDLQRHRNVFINPQIFDALGYSQGELQGRSLEALNDLVHPEDHPALEELTQATRRSADGEVREAEYRIRHADGRYRWFLLRETPFQRDAEGAIVQVLGTALDITARRQADDHQQMLIRELHHRVKNILATVQAIASATGRSAKTFAEFRDDFSNRLVSLGRTHSLLTNEAWAGADLRDIFTNELQPYLGEGSERVTIEGPNVTIPRDMAVSVGMAIHELTTNAVKYGALSVPDGRVAVTIETDGAAVEPRLTVIWTERGGPEVKVPDRRGFGSLLLNRLLSSQLGGEVAIDYQPEGVVAHLRLVLRQDDRR